MSVPRTIFITGANRGIGLELVKQLCELPEPPETIFATYRTRDQSDKLFEIAKKTKRVQPVLLDVKNHASFPNVVQQVSSFVGNKGLNLLINNAGILTPKQGLFEVTHEQMIDANEVNVISPLFLSREFLPLLKLAGESGYGQPYTWSQSAIINITSFLGSSTHNTNGDRYAYRPSKASLNIITKSLSIDLKSDKILAVALHPGHVKTDLGGDKAPLEVWESASYMIKTMMGLNEKSNGGFISFDGSVLSY